MSKWQWQCPSVSLSLGAKFDGSSEQQRKRRAAHLAASLFRCVCFAGQAGGLWASFPLPGRSALNAALSRWSSEWTGHNWTPRTTSGTLGPGTWQLSPSGAPQKGRARSRRSQPRQMLPQMRLPQMPSPQDCASGRSAKRKREMRRPETCIGGTRNEPASTISSWPTGPTRLTNGQGRKSGGRQSSNYWYQKDLSSPKDELWQASESCRRRFIISNWASFFLVGGQQDFFGL